MSSQAVKYAKTLKKSSGRKKRLSKERELPKLEDIRNVLAQRKLSRFIKAAWPFIDSAKYKHNWHIDAMSEHLEAVNDGHIKRLLINIPPRHMKSLEVSVFWPVWTWIQDVGLDDDGYPLLPLKGPGVKWLFASYAINLAIRDSVKCRRLMLSTWFLNNWGRFSGKDKDDQLYLTGDQNQKMRFENNHGGYRLATSVDGQLTGEGGDIIVVDDPHNVKQAESDIVREGTLQWWKESLSTRLNDPENGAYVIIMQRVHDKDLAGHVLAEEATEDGSDWVHLCLPARYETDHPFIDLQNSGRTINPLNFKDPRTEDGELLWPDRMGNKALTKLEVKLGPYATAGQMQQRPSPREGGIFQKSWFEGQIIPASEVPLGGVRLRSWDLAGSETDRAKYTAGVKMKRKDGDIYIIHVVRFRGTPGRVEKKLLSTAKKDGKKHPIGIPQDPGQAGKAQKRYLAKKLSGFIVRFRPETGDKVTRATAFSSQCEAGNVFLVEGDWNDDYIDELCMFDKGDYSDQVDASSNGFHMLMELAIDDQDIGSPVEVEKTGGISMSSSNN